jgi:GT2 family glycosyltransferase
MTSTPGTSAEASPVVTAVIVTYQSRATIGATLASIKPSRDARLIDVVVVDNDSRDGTPEHVHESFPWVRVIQAGDNLGFGRGCNLGFEHVETPYTLFLNPDATLSQEALETLLSFMQPRPKVGMCAPAIREADGTLQVAGVLPTPMGLIRDAIGLRGYPAIRDIQIGGEPFRTNWLCGAILLVRSGVFRAVKGFDPRFFLYFEETDLCRKVMNEGFELWAVGTAFAEHECGASTKQSGVSMAHQCIGEHYYRSRFYYLIKHHGWLAATLTEVGTIPLLGLRALFKRSLGRTDNGEFKERLAAPILRLPDPTELQ